MLTGWGGISCYRPSFYCPIQYAYWKYPPSLGTNIAFAVIFSLSFIAFVLQGIATRKWIGFTIAMALGCMLEIIGYAGRILAHRDMFDETSFLIQVVCLTLGPAFLAAGIYFCLSIIVVTIEPRNSRIKPMSYPKIFIPCDIISLLLQAIGGGITSVALHNNEDLTQGTNIMIAGLAFQVATMTVFISLAADFAWRTYRNRAVNMQAPDHRQPNLNPSRRFKAFLIALTLSTLCIFTRCVFRVAELSDGWRGRLATTQKYFVGLEGAVIAASVLLLNICHPAFCFKDAAEPGNEQLGSRTWFARKLSADDGNRVESDTMLVEIGSSAR